MRPNGDSYAASPEHCIIVADTCGVTTADAQPYPSTLGRDNLPDTLDPGSRSALPPLYVRIQESIFHHFANLSAGPEKYSAACVTPKILAAVDELSKVLSTAGIDMRTLDRNAENALRLTMLASLIETLRPAFSPTGSARTMRALPKWRLSRVLRYIDDNICKPIKLVNLASTAGLSRTYFCRQFRAATGLRPHEYVLRKRIEHAKQMLAATSNTLVDVGLDVGFQTQAHFTTVFKRIVGKTPLQWRREYPMSPERLYVSATRG